MDRLEAIARRIAEQRRQDWDKATEFQKQMYLETAQIVIDEAGEYQHKIDLHGSRHQLALDIQDAVNLKALARWFVAVVDDADNEHHSTIGVWEDPAVRLFVNKFESLCSSDSNFSKAYRECLDKANEATDGQWRPKHERAS
jgi:hypothetical protein